MARCAYCGEKVGDEGLYVDEEVFCSEECMRDYGAESYDDDDDYDDDDEGEEEEGDYEDDSEGDEDY